MTGRPLKITKTRPFTSWAPPNAKLTERAKKQKEENIRRAQDRAREFERQARERRAAREAQGGGTK